MKISEFVNKALFDEKTGYYITRNPLGDEGDFITAPEISSIFSEILAAYLLQICAVEKDNFAMVEMGAGRGVMMRDILNSIKKLADKKNPEALNFLAKAQINIIEIGEKLKEIQQENLKDFQINWHKNFSEFLEKTAGKIFFISNELFDCFAIDQYSFTEMGWCERIVGNERFLLAPFDREIHNFIESEMNALVPMGSVYEINFAARDFMKTLCEALKNRGGMAVNIDYGYYKPERANTLQALKNHKSVTIFTKNCDITAQVDFGALDKIAANFNLGSSLVTQREFLISLGIKEREAILIAQNPQMQENIALAVSRLIDENQMGKLFKCHIIWKE